VEGLTGLDTKAEVALMNALGPVHELFVPAGPDVEISNLSTPSADCTGKALGGLVLADKVKVGSVST
jgi:hypothetical protein